MVFFWADTCPNVSHSHALIGGSTTSCSNYYPAIKPGTTNGFCLSDRSVGLLNIQTIWNIGSGSDFRMFMIVSRMICDKGVRFFLDTPVRRRRVWQLHMFQFEVLSHAKPEYMEKREAAKVRRATGVRATDEFWYLPKLPKSMLRQPCGRYVIVERNMRSEWSWNVQNSNLHNSTP